MIVKIKGKRYRWNPEDMHPALLYGALALSILASIYAWYIFIGAAIIIGG